MSSFFWNYEMDAEFPLSLLEFVTKGDHEKIHWHNYLQIVLCTGGSGKFIFTNREYDVEAGDVFIVSDFENHVAISGPQEQTEYIFVIFLPALIAAPGSRQFDFEYLYPFYYNTKTFDNKIDHSLPVAQAISKEVLTLRDIWNKKETAYRHELDAGVRKTLALLMRHYQSVYEEYYTPDSLGHARVADAIAYINLHFDTAITVQEVADKLHMSESAFRSLFKEAMRMPFKEYVTFLRLTKAKKLLLTTNDSINTVANLSGYTNMNQFYKVFHKYVFMSPAEYRNFNH
ncbi:MAG: AraC family transcriptional regulator [Christensenella sp.]|uniref:helix-turn-helix transcriptional regulator n=1 Tax=Christensenella sp. TaxID=1935934 RepID=UPI002B210A69|nr:AraC family transcriptional regulator [Christensenella sp.]MEA5004374.1 AraC family transcriptional regulator [Christensenella sp.]